MSKLRLTGSSSGYTELTSPAVGGNNTLTLPTGNGSSGQVLSTNGSGALSWIGAGKILQVVSGSTSTTVTVTAATYTDSGLSASITPSNASNKILVIINQPISLTSTTTVYAGTRLLRDSTVIHVSSGDSTGPDEYGSSSSNLILRASLIYLDSPATTSSVTYKTQGRPYSATSSRSISFQPTGATNNGTSYIYLVEVAA